MHIDFVMCKKGDPSGFLNIHIVAKLKTNDGGHFGDNKKNLRKKVTQSRNNMQKKFGQGRDSNPRPSSWQISKNSN